MFLDTHSLKNLTPSCRGRFSKNCNISHCSSTNSSCAHLPARAKGRFL